MPLNPEEARAVLFEFFRRHTPKERPKTVKQFWPFVAGLHAAQRRFREDPAKRKAGICSGRAGKSTVAAAMLVEAVGDIPDSNGVYVAPTRGMAKRILWKELKRLNEQWSLGIDFNETDLTATMRNGSTIYLVGANNADQIDKIRGIPIVLAVIDEAGMIGAHLEELIEEVISPRLMDFDGSLVLIGTPTAACAGYFFEVTQEDERKRKAGWAVHHWTVLDNPYVPRYDSFGPNGEITLRKGDAKAWVERELALKGWTKDHPVAQREYFGRWMRSAEHLVFHDFSRDRNVIAAKPKRADWMYGLGLDLGWDDGVGITEIAFSQDYEYVYATRAWHHDKMIVSDLAKFVQKIDHERAGLAFCVVDQSGAGKMIAQEIEQRWGIPCKGAEKTRKPTFLRLLNSDLRLGRLKIIGHETSEGLLAGPCAPLLEEVPLLQWDPVHLEKGRFIEDDRIDNDVSDGFIYAYREARHYLARDVEAEEATLRRDPDAPDPNSDEAKNLAATNHRRKLQEALRRDGETEWFEGGE